MKASIDIRDLSAASGERKEGWLTIGETAGGALRIPLVIINGSEDGPVLCFTAGVHATEYAPIDAVMRLLQTLQPETLYGAVIGVPVANMPMFATRTGFVSPLDGLNLNKIAPGRCDGSISEILADVLLNEIIRAAEYHIDFHAGDFGELLLPFAGYALTGDREMDEKGEALARAFTPGMISLSTEGSNVPPFPGSLNFSATRNGVVSILAEAGGDGTLEEADVEMHFYGALSVMSYLGMIDGRVRAAREARPASPASHSRSHHAPRARLSARDRIVVRATRAGLLRLKVGIGDAITTGQELAEVCDVFGAVVERVYAPGSGIAGLIWSHKVVNTGDPVVRYWITERA